MALYTASGFNAPPSIEQVAEKLCIPVEAIDEEYGVVLVDPSEGRYCILTKWDVDAGGDSEETGPWANPPIEHF